MNTDGVLGGLWADREGYVDTTGTVFAYANAAKMRGAEVVEHNKVVELNQRTDSTWDVVSSNRSIDVHIVGKRFAARILENPPWDPAGERMRV